MAKHKRIYAGEKEGANSPEFIDSGEFTDGIVFLERDASAESTGLKFWAKPTKDANAYRLWNGLVTDATVGWTATAVVEYEPVQTFHASSGTYDTGTHWAVELPLSKVPGASSTNVGEEGHWYSNTYRQDSKLPAYFAVTHTFETLKYTYELHQQRKIR